MRRTWPHSQQLLLTQQPSDNNLSIGCAMPGIARRGRIHSWNCSCVHDWQTDLRNKPTQSWFANHGCVLILAALIIPQTEGKTNVSATKVEKFLRESLAPSDSTWFSMTERTHLVYSSLVNCILFQALKLILQAWHESSWELLTK